MAKSKILLVGESWISSSTHYKGFDHFVSATSHFGAQPLLDAMRDSDYEIVWMPAHDVPEKFPSDIAALAEYKTIILSDIGSNSFLLHPDVWLHGKPSPNRLKILRQWTEIGGGLVMIGGYLSFQGIDGRARWRGTPIEDVLPVTCLPYDDRIEIPEGFEAVIDSASTHPILAGLDGKWPLLLGVNEVVLRQSASANVLAHLPADHGGHPLLVTGQYGKGRTVAWTSDVGPHWLPTSFSSWPGYPTLWRNILSWTSGDLA